jgi:hypothetical protein
MSQDEREQPHFNEDGEYKRALERAATFTHPVDILEPEIQPEDFRQGYREASKRFLYIINYALSSIIEADNPRNQAWAVAFAVGSGVCAGRSMDDIGDTLGIGRAAISKSAKAFCRSLDLEPSTYMKSAKASTKYRDARIQSINEANNATRN